MTHQHLSKITYKMLSPNMVPKVVDSITKSFATDPFSIALNLDKKNWTDMATLFVERAAKKDLSLVAINNENDQIVGCIINEDWKTREPEEFHTSLDKKWDPVKSIFSNLHHRYKQEHPNSIRFGEVIHSLYFTCVVPSSRGQGVAYDMWYHSTDIGRAHNFQYMCAETATVSGQKLCEQIGFTPKSSIPYNKFEYQGERIFQKLPQVDPNFEKLTIWEKKIVSNLY
ncbi:hypothetical protein RB653_005622 [Dictyostelium firmibasis]|uniref:N-acetyltransferase domain-containing protein n=1 Tax=Dictyostelium firmibasis TaxID=79012 RepID=A0AAN7Z4J7_9MYCE